MGREEVIINSVNHVTELLTESLRPQKEISGQFIYSDMARPY